MKKRVLLLLAIAVSALQAMALSKTDFGSNNYIEAWGQLKLVTTSNSGNNKVQLADRCGNAVQLRGWATHGYQWASVRPFFNAKNDFEGMKKMGANVVRLTCYVSQDDVPYQSSWNNTKTWVKNAITWCHELGIYAIVDYHVLTPGNPNTYLQKANNAKIWEKAEPFFTDISAFVKQNGYHHVLYEICNEPNGGAANWDAIRDYANVILPIIAGNDPNAVVIVGTPNWSQYLTHASGNPLTHPTLQIMYTFHFYACTHSGLLNQGSHFTDAVLRSIPVFATEWNNTNNYGQGDCASTAYRTFLDRCNNDATQRVSWTAWSWSPAEMEEKKPVTTPSVMVVRTSSTWKDGTPDDGTGYTANNLSPTGLMIYEELQKNHINYYYYDSNCAVITKPNVESTASIAFSIYPNPAKNGNFQITLPTHETAVLSIINVQGQTVYSTTIKEKETTIKADLETGIYLVTVKSENGKGARKLVVE